MEAICRYCAARISGRSGPATRDALEDHYLLEHRDEVVAEWVEFAKLID